MKGLFSKVMGVFTGLVAVLGISAADATPSIADISAKSALYLEHGKSIDSNTICPAHGSHVSHASHHSHTSSR